MISAFLDVFFMLSPIVQVNCTPDFGASPLVINGFSDLMVEIFGQCAVAPRSAVGMCSLPLGTAVEIEAIWELAEDVDVAPTTAAPAQTAIVPGILTGACKLFASHGRGAGLLLVDLMEWRLWLLIASCWCFLDALQCCGKSFG